MTMRHWTLVAAGWILATAATSAAALSNDETASGLKAAISRGAEFAVTELSKPNGYLGNESVRIGMPESLAKVERLARQLGYDKQADELINAMNHAAESAVVQAKPLLVNAVKSMSIKDAGDILTGPQDAATQYFRRTTSADLASKFLPVVKKETAKVQLAQKYNEFAGKAASMGLIDAGDADLDNYVTRKALDGLYLMIAAQEKQIRDDPVGTGSNLLKKVFGSLGR